VAGSIAKLSHLKVRHLQLILHLVDQGTLHKAARALNMSQPAASAMLSDLESSMGVRFFDRTHRGVQLTDEGLQIVDSVKTLLNEFDNFAGTVERLAAGRQPQLRVGVVPQAFAAYLPQAINRFRVDHGCAIRTEEGTAKQLLAALWEGHLDCVIGRLPSTGIPEGIDATALRFENLYEEPVCIAYGPLAKVGERMPSYHWLGEQQWVLQRRDSSVRHALNEAFLRHGVQPPQPVVETSNYMQSLTLVAGSGFFTVAPLHAAELQSNLRTVHILAMDLGVAPMQVSFISRASNSGNAQLGLFASAFRSVLPGS
jgi:DNA-binding transcriptional LysR family regulator